jgi:hypothetical protein
MQFVIKLKSRRRYRKEMQNNPKKTRKDEERETTETTETLWLVCFPPVFHSFLMDIRRHIIPKEGSEA